MPYPKLLFSCVAKHDSGDASLCVGYGQLVIRTISRTLPSNVTMMCSGTGGNGKAQKACVVGDAVGDEDAEDVGESIVVMVCVLL